MFDLYPDCNTWARHLTATASYYTAVNKAGLHVKTENNNKRDPMGLLTEQEFPCLASVF